MNKHVKHSKKFTIDSDLSEVKVLANHLNVFCAGNSLNKRLSGLLELVLVEAINNIIIHAYEGKRGFDIKASFEISKSDVVITLKDKGKIFKRNKLQQDKPKFENEELAEGSWGLGLISSIADEINRCRENGTNVLTIRKKIT